MRGWLVVGGCSVLVVLTALLGIRYGATDIPLSRVCGILLSESGIGTVQATPQERAIVWHIRTPRVLTGGLVGAMLALSGVLLQGLFRNPMASPGIIGVSTGGALGATLMLAVGLGAVSLWAVPVAAFGGALMSAFMVYALATERGRSPTSTLILCGLAINAITGALTSLVLSYSVREWEAGRQILFWLMGGLTDRTWEHVGMVAPFALLSFAAAGVFWRELNLMLAGEESATALGVDTARTKRWILAIAAGAAGAAVAVSGVIGFVGLIVPHIFRLLVGPDHRRLIPSCIVGGALFLMSVDLACRTVLAREEIRLGIVTSVLGGPFFLYLVVRNRKRAEVF